MEAFRAVAGPSLAWQAQALERVANISAIRDTLVPRLVSGRLTMLDAEMMTEEAVACR